MSVGPTGVRGVQGVRGEVGDGGPIGIPGMIGPQGSQGPVGVTGATGIMGSTGIQLDGNGSLVQCTSRIGGDNIFVSNDNFYNIPFNTPNPSLVGNLSTTISGQYDASGINYYGTPLQITDGSNFAFPSGKYYITAVLPIGSASGLEAALVMTESNVNIANSTSANPGSDCILQHFFTPSQDTSITFRVYISRENPVPIELFPSISSDFQNINVSIVKIW
jgi:hypothetical protein